jgi:NadR type nicotinamide-nucleotide adenylyltransferase
MSGLCIGKFYPLHRGHRYLIDTAKASVDRLYIILCGKPDESPSPQLRESWLRELYPTATVIRITDVYNDDNDSQLWARLTVEWLGFVPDRVFTSEWYGEPWSKFLGCQHTLVDKERSTYPVSGTAVRKNPLQHWQYLDEPVRAFYAVRIIFVGAESTGKTTLSEHMAKHLDTTWVPEYGREYSERMLELDGCYNWSSEDFVKIATRQCEMENAAARTCNRVLIGDTDAFATAIWHRRYMESVSEEVEKIAEEHKKPDLYVLTDVKGAVFVQDGTRDGTDVIRQYMQDEFIKEMDRKQVRYVVVCGDTWKEREEHCKQLLNEYLKERLA